MLPVLFYCCAVLLFAILSCFATARSTALLSCWLSWFARVCTLQDAMASAAGMEGVLIMLHDKAEEAKDKAASKAAFSGEGNAAPPNDVSINR